MANKLIFITNNNIPYEEIMVSYEFYPGFAISQKQKSVSSLHEAIKKKFPEKNILEVSTKSKDQLGIKLSAFNLRLNGIPLESVFQSSKVFSGGIQYKFLIKYKPGDAKKYIKENSKGFLEKFNYNGQDFPLYPKSLFYDYIYICALRNVPNLSIKLKEYDIFTDIEFNEKKSINCQARSCAIYSYMLRNNCVDSCLSNIDEFKKIYSRCYSENLISLI